MSGKSVSRLPLVGTLLLGLLAAGCVSGPSPGDPSNPTPFLAQRKPEAGSRLGAVRKPFNFVYRTDPAMLQQIRSSLSGRTILVSGGGHGPQIEYYAANGRSYLWYPGNRQVVAGRWTVEEKVEADLFGGRNAYAKVCTLYGGNTYNPVTRSTGATPDCTSVDNYKIYTKELAPGDPFHLASGKVPFVLMDEGPVPTLDKLYAEANGVPR